MTFVNFLDPIIWNPETREFGKEHVAGFEAHGPVDAHAHAQVPPAGSETTTHAAEGFNLAHAAQNALGSHTAAEWLFIVISLVVAAVGILLGFLFYVWRPSLPDIWAARLKPLYLASYNKYWVDEIYGWAITRRTMDLSRAVYSFDSKVIDGAVNGSAWLTRTASRITGGVDQYFVDGLVNAIAAFVVRLMSPLFRAAQTGFTQNYALVMVIGLVAAVALFFAADIIIAVKKIFAIGI